MKKIFIALSVLAALTFSVVPSQALIGIPDNVAGNTLFSIFMVDTSGSGLDTLMIVEDVGGNANPGPLGAAVDGSACVHWDIRNVRSEHLGDHKEPYTNYQVLPLSARDLITDGVGDKSSLVQTIAGREVWVGYIRFINQYVNSENSVPKNNLVGKSYFTDILNGQACAVNMAAYEYMPNPPAWPAIGDLNRIFPGYAYLAAQLTTDSNIYTGAEADFFVNAAPVANAPLEGFSAQALAASEQREASPGVTAANVVAPTAFYLLPRYYLPTADAENYLFIWKSENVAGATNTGRINVDFYDIAENARSGYIILKDELNILDVKTYVPPAFQSAYPAAGWIDIYMTAALAANLTNWNTVDWIGYNWQILETGGASTNWSIMYEIPRYVFWAGK